MASRKSERPSCGSRRAACVRRRIVAIALASVSSSPRSTSQKPTSPAAAARDGFRERTSEASLRRKLWKRARRSAFPMPRSACTNPTGPASGVKPGPRTSMRSPLVASRVVAWRYASRVTVDAAGQRGSCSVASARSRPTTITARFLAGSPRFTRRATLPTVSTSKPAADASTGAARARESTSRVAIRRARPDSIYVDRASTAIPRRARLSLRAQELDELRRRRREVLALAVDDPERPQEGLVGDVDHGERLRAQLGLHDGLGQQRHAAPDLDHPLDGLDVVELHHVAHVDAVAAEDAVGLLAGGDVALEADHRLAGELRDRHLAVTGERMPGRADEHEPVLAEGDIVI